jgi:ribosomal protein S12 methylthiotransferase accessory factor
MVTFGVTSTSPFARGSNGLASGAHVLEAMLSGLLEVVERDGASLSEFDCPSRVVDPAPFLEVVAPELLEWVQRSKVALQVVDATSEIGVPTFVATVRDAPEERVGFFGGSGASTDVGVAIVRAVTEAFQSRCILVAGARDDIFASRRRAALSEGPKVPPPSSDPPREVTTGGLVGATTLVDRIAWVLERLRRSGHASVIVLRHTAPGDLVQVVRVIVPGLEGYRARYNARGARAVKRGELARVSVP